jgi:glycosyltransferase involved in cell wall biosynthesis
MLVDRESGRLVPPDDPAALAAAVIDLLGAAETRRRLGETARTRLTGEFALDAFAHTMFGAFEDAVRDGVA